VLTRVPLLLLEQARRLGVDRRVLMTEAGLSPTDFKDLDGRVPSSKIWKLWQALIRQVPDVALGLRMGDNPRSPIRYGLVGYTLAYSRTVQEALHRLARYSRIISETIQVGVEKRGGRCRILLESDPQFELLRHPIDTRLANILSAVRNLSGKPVAPIEVELPYPKLADTSYHRHFFDAPLRFSRPKAALWFYTTDLELPIQHADDTLVGYLDRLAEEKLKELSGTSLSERLGRALWSELSGGMPPLRRVAELVGMSPRTLQRYLRKEGKTYRTALEEFRREMSTHLMHHRKLAVYEVAFLLGYADPSSFHRAFRRWHRKSPRAYRRAS
ncbi:MAG: AraC family transcriptional regulator, partial [Acidobacteria bacterium]|nr:AraC family transcriptional regulator [Acidobacteriota bacterium]